MMGRRREPGPLDELSPRDREVLKEMAEGKSNRGIAEALIVSEAAAQGTTTRPGGWTPSRSATSSSRALQSFARAAG
jgi:FixJ family two-component response regulator